MDLTQPTDDNEHIHAPSPSLGTSPQLRTMAETDTTANVSIDDNTNHVVLVEEPTHTRNDSTTQFDLTSPDVMEISTPAPQPPPSSLSIQRTTTPTYLSGDDRIFEAWIQQSLTMPSATGAGTGENVDRSSFRIDAGVPTTRHRRERSLGSAFFSENGHSLGIHPSSGHTPPPSMTTHRNTSTSSYSFSTTDFHSSWSNHSVPNATPTTSATAEDFFNMSVLPLTSTLSSSDHPLLSRVSSSASPSREDDDGGISSVIHDAARITSWPAVIELCKTQPEAAAYIGKDGWTALHHACNRRCPVPEAVEALIRAYPDALLVEEDKGWLPLHYACRFKAPLEAVRLLLRMYPDKGRFGVSRPDRKGRTPLWYAVRYDAPEGVPSLLLEVDPSNVLEEDQNSETPIALVWDQFAEKLDGKRTLNRIMGAGMDENNSQHGGLFTATRFDEETTDVDLMEKARMVQKNLDAQKAWLKRWNKVNAFLRAAFGFAWDEDWEIIDSPEEKKKDSPGGQLCSSSSPRRKFRILHAVSAVKCHHSLFLLAAALHPEQAFEVDNHDLKRIETLHGLSDDVEQPRNISALHLAASSRAKDDTGKLILTQLLQLNPDASRSVDSSGSTPLHRIAENKHKNNWLADGVNVLYDANSEAVRIPDMHGRLPLHRAAKAITYYDGLDDDVIAERSKICRLLQENSDAAHQKDNFGCLPLHLVAKHGKRWDRQVQALYDANPAAVRTRTGVKYNNRLPLHLAATNSNADVSLISKLLELNPRSASQSDRKGSYPLHLACESGLSWKCIRPIYEANPEAIRQAEQNSRKWMSLHIAAAKNSDDDLTFNLAQLYPDACKVADANGQYPLHLACTAGKSWEMSLSTLFEAFPEAICSRDKDGFLPLHILSFLVCAEQTAKSREPQVIDIRSRRLSRAAAVFDVEQKAAKEFEEAKEIGTLFNLLKADPTVLV